MVLLTESTSSSNSEFGIRNSESSPLFWASQCEAEPQIRNPKSEIRNYFSYRKSCTVRTKVSIAWTGTSGVMP